MIGSAVLLLFVALLLIGLPIAFAMGLSSMVGLLLLGTGSWIVVAMQTFQGLKSFPLVAIPLFLLMANLMAVGGVTNALVDFANSLVGHVRGSLAIGNVVASTLFAGISGSSLADTSAVGSMMIPAMIRDGYPPEFAGAVTAAANIVGPIIPPSILMILYGFAAGQSIIELFLAGIIPGLMLSVALAGVAVWMCRRNGYGSTAHKFTMRHAIRSFLITLPALVIPALIVAGISGGVFTITESAGAAALYALLYAVGRGLVRRQMPWKELYIAFQRTAVDTGVIMILVGVSSLLGWVLIRSNLPQTLVGELGGFNRWQTLALMNLILVVFGMFLEPAASVLIATALLLPLAKSLDVNLVHFGVIMVVNLQIGVLTPPVAGAAFVTARIAGVSFETQVRALLPFLLMGFAMLTLVTYVPWFSLAIPKLIH